jgi:hypothetical protein
VDSHARSCPRCQAALSAASRLRSKKLGKHERRHLLQAAPPGDPPAPILPPEPSQTVQTATRRAVANLCDHGLIVLEPGTVRVYPHDAEASALLGVLQRKYAVLRRASRTPLGEQVVRHYRQELEAGERIRWEAGKLGDVVEDTLGLCPDR